jgi:hypothetical protein
MDVYTLGEKIVLYLGTTFLEVVLRRRIIHMMRFMRDRCSVARVSLLVTVLGITRFKYGLIYRFMSKVHYLYLEEIESNTIYPKIAKTPQLHQ